MLYFYRYGRSSKLHASTGLSSSKRTAVFPKKGDFINKTLVFAIVVLALFSFCAQETVIDADGNRYHTKKFGRQVWTVENYRSTKFNDGTPIPLVTDSVAWHFLLSPGYCYFGNTNNADSIRKYGALYNWYCVGSKKFAPPGWRVPTDEDWDTLQDYLIQHGYNWDNEKRDNRIAKSMAAQSGWKPFGITGMPGNNMQDNNRSGFSGFPTGFRCDAKESATMYPIFWAKGHKASWWSATNAGETMGSVYGLGFCVDDLMRHQLWLKTCGYTVRLVKTRR